MTGPKIGLIDIETAPIEGHVWGLFDQTVGLNQIKTEWSVLSFTYKELHAPRKSLLYVDTQGSPRDDRAICSELWHILHDNDFLIAQNGKRFDMRKIKARLIMHGFTPPSPVKVIDTMLMARQVAAGCGFHQQQAGVAVHLPVIHREVEAQGLPRLRAVEGMLGRQPQGMV